MNLQLESKLALVTGSTAGIGLVIAKALAAEGARVIVNGRTETRVKEAIASIRGKVPTPQLEGLALDLAIVIVRSATATRRLQAVTRTREQAAPRRWDHKISQMRRSYEAQRERS